MASSFKTVGIIGKFSDTTIGGTIQVLADSLITRKLKVILEEATAQILYDTEPLEGVPITAMGERCDLIIIVGGDGTLLHAARTLAHSEVPLVGINLGRLGFLADISPTEMLSRLNEIIDGKFDEERRFLLSTDVKRDGQTIHEGNAFNDVVVHKWNTMRMIEFETYINGQRVNNQRSDGLIVSTPTGSTAYALSCGGPILHPTLDAITLVPISPHTLSNRPLVVSSDSDIEIIVKVGDEGHARVTSDGQTSAALMEGDRIKITKLKHQVRLIHPLNHNHYQILRAKLGWG